VGLGILESLKLRARAKYCYHKSLWSEAVHARPHRLSGELLVSLTSYPPRFKTLEATIRCLLAQNVQPDAVILWITEDDIRRLPKGVRRLRSPRFLIEPAPELRSYKKIIPCLRKAPRAFIVTCDDDAYYPRTWLSELLDTYEPGSKVVACNRAHRILLDTEGNIRPYLQWEMETKSGDAAGNIFPTGIGGVLYEPGVFYSDVISEHLFRQLCPSADDIWLYWMAALNGNAFLTTARMNEPITWPASQQTALSGSNAFFGSGNDEQIQRMVAAYGMPPNLAS
jgi:hypothetical protein